MVRCCKNLRTILRRPITYEMHQSEFGEQTSSLIRCKPNSCASRPSLSNHYPQNRIFQRSRKTKYSPTEQRNTLHQARTRQTRRSHPHDQRTSCRPTSALFRPRCINRHSTCPLSAEPHIVTHEHHQDSQRHKCVLRSAIRYASASGGVCCGLG